jgi:hypothetical protein
VGPQGITTLGEEIKFRVELNAIDPKVSYSWSVNAGTIVKGQGTPEINVATTRELAGKVVTATVELGGLPFLCPRSASETVGIDQGIACSMPSDEWSALKPDDERTRLDMFFAELSNNPNDTGLIILRVEEGDKIGPDNRRIQFVLKHAKFRRFDKRRLWFAIETEGERSTVVWRLVPGGENPCQDCLTYRGESL